MYSRLPPHGGTGGVAAGVGYLVLIPRYWRTQVRAYAASLLVSMAALTAVALTWRPRRGGRRHGMAVPAVRATSPC